MIKKSYFFAHVRKVKQNRVCGGARGNWLIPLHVGIVLFVTL